MPVPVYLDLAILSTTNILLSVIAFEIPGREPRIRVEREAYERVPPGSVWRVVGIAIASVVFGLLLILGEVPFLYQFLFDFVFVGLVASFLRLREVDSPRRTASILVVLFLLTGIGAGAYYGVYAQVNNSIYFNSLLTFQPGSTLFSNSTLQIDKLPLVSEDYAMSIASSHLSDYGGSVQLVDDEQIISGAQPYWIFTVAPTNTFAENNELGFILVNAVNGSYYEVKSQNTVGPGLFLFNEIDLHSYLGDTSIVVGNHYPTPPSQNFSTIYYVFTQSQVRLDGVTAFNGGVIYGADGSPVAQYSGLNSPSYVNQPWDKFLVANLASQWGSTRAANNSFSIFAGGFFTIPASQFRLALSSDEELIPYKNGTALMLFMSPANAPNSLAGVILAYRDQFTFYNMQGMNLISPDYAEATVQSKLPALSNGQLFAANPVIYPEQGGFVWIVPYYYDSGTGIVQFQGIAVMDASNAGNLVIQAAQGSIANTRDIALAGLLGGVTGNQTQNTQTEVNGTVQSFVTYVQSGNTYASIELNGTYYYATANSLPFAQWVQALQLKTGDSIQIQVQGQEITGLTVVTQ
ncbi:MAG: hypothetical protein OK449_07805 [Thaumarchaeota archaeon]|nr:hypothetical protein [Nitrososphaerota archaeon]